jgi:glycosyltransferase involved in cell wall biosynthesis
MSRLLILGSGPLLFEDAHRTYAPGARTWQITEPLLADGHEVLLIGQRLPLSYPEDLPMEMVVRNEPGFVYRSVRAEIFQSPGYLQGLSDEFEPDAVIYPHASASFSSKWLAPEQPVWIDLNGHLMTEAQAKAAVYRDDNYLDHFYLMELDMLTHGDVYSTVCDPQTWALLGELGLAGRLNAATNDRLLVESVPVGVSDEEYHPTGRAFRGLDVPPEAFVVLWSGGYNTWTDVDTMFAGLEYAMERNPELHFVSTGGQIDGHDEITYPHMVSLVEGSEHRDRFHLRGWIPRAEVPNYYLEADVGLNCEKPILEVTFGSKQRILDWSRAELPCLSSRLTELSQVMEREKAGWVFQPGNADELGRRLVAISDDRDAAREMGRYTRRRFREIFAYGKTIEPFRGWARDPWLSPDRKRDPHCLESMMDEILKIRVDHQRLAEKVGELDGQPVAHDGAGEPSVAEPAPEGESALAWALRVTRNSYRQGGLPLVVRRFAARLTGGGNPPTGS